MNEITIELRKGIEIVLIDPPSEYLEAYRRAVWFAASWGWDNTFYRDSKDYKRIIVRWAQLLVDMFPNNPAVELNTGAVASIETGEVWIGQELRDRYGNIVPYDQVSCFVHELRHLWQWHTGNYNTTQVDGHAFNLVLAALDFIAVNDSGMSWLAYVVRDHELDAFRAQYAWMQVYRSNDYEAVQNTLLGFKLLAAIGIPGFTPHTAMLPGRGRKS